jgi:hypothetical protein
MKKIIIASALLIALLGCIRPASNAQAEKRAGWMYVVEGDINYGLSRYENNEVVCYVMRAVESNSLQCKFKGESNVK